VILAKISLFERAISLSFFFAHMSGRDFSRRFLPPILKMAGPSASKSEHSRLYPGEELRNFGRWEESEAKPVSYGFAAGPPPPRVWSFKPFWFACRLISLISLLCLFVAGVYFCYGFFTKATTFEVNGVEFAQGAATLLHDVSGELAEFYHAAGHDFEKLKEPVLEMADIVADHGAELLQHSSKAVQAAGAIVTTAVDVAGDVLVPTAQAFKLGVWMMECLFISKELCSENLFDKFKICPRVAMSEKDGMTTASYEGCVLFGYEISEKANFTWKASIDKANLETAFVFKHTHPPDRDVYYTFVQKHRPDRANMNVNGRNKVCPADLDEVAMWDCCKAHCLMPGGYYGMLRTLFVDCMLAETAADWERVRKDADEVATMMDRHKKQSRGGVPSDTVRLGKRRTAPAHTSEPTI